MISLNQLAKRLGMAKSTVSRALSNHPNVSADTRERVLHAAREYGYERSNRMSEAMRVARSGAPGKYRDTIACLSIGRSLKAGNHGNPEGDTLDTDVPRRKLYLQGIEERAAQLGCKVDFLDLDPTGLDRLIHILESRGIQRIIVFAPINVAGLLRLPEMTQLRSRFSAVFLGTPNMYPNLATMIQPDLFAAGFHALIRAWQAGYYQVFISRQIRQINFDGRFMSGVAYARDSFQGEIEVSELQEIESPMTMLERLPRNSCLIGGILPKDAVWFRQHFPSKQLPGWMDWHANLHARTARVAGIDQRDLDQGRRAVDLCLSAQRPDDGTAGPHPSDKLTLDPSWVDGDSLRRIPQPHDGLGRCLSFRREPKNLRFFPVILQPSILEPAHCVARLLGHSSFPFPRSGSSRFHSIPFEIPPERCVCIASTQTRVRQSSAASVSIGRTADELYFLHGACHARTNAELGRYKVCFSDGSCLDVPIRASIPDPKAQLEVGSAEVGGNIRDYWHEIPPLENDLTLPVRSIHSAMTFQCFGFHYLFRWINPCPGKLIERIVLSAHPGKPTVLLLFGITVANDVFSSS